MGFTMINEFWDKVILVLAFTLLQGALWAWVGLQARKAFPWWPL